MRAEICIRENAVHYHCDKPPGMRNVSTAKESVSFVDVRRINLCCSGSLPPGEPRRGCAPRAAGNGGVNLLGASRRQPKSPPCSLATAVAATYATSALGHALDATLECRILQNLPRFHASMHFTLGYPRFTVRELEDFSFNPQECG